MSGTRKLEKFELDRLASGAAFESGTRRLEKVGGANALALPTPVAEMSPAILAAARPSRHSMPPADLDEDVPPPRAARTVDRDASVERLRTRMARKFTTLADQVTEGFEDFRIGAGAWTVELTAPDGMSTAGGKRVLQHLRLRPTRQGHVVLVGGVVNAVEKSAELRDFDHMQTIYQARFGQPLEITPAEWEQFLRKAEVVLHQETIRTARAPAPRDLLMRSEDAAPATWTNRKLAMTVLGLVAFLAAAVVCRVLFVLLQ